MHNDRRREQVRRKSHTMRMSLLIAANSMRPARSTNGMSFKALMALLNADRPQEHF